MDEYADLEIKVCRTVLHILGLWPSDEAKNYKIRLRLTILLVTMIGFSNVPQTMRLLELTGNFDETLEMIVNCDLTMFLTVIKSLNLLSSRKALNGLLVSMAENWKVAKTRADRLIMRKNAKLSHLTSMILFSICGSAVLALLALNSYNRAEASRNFRDGKVNASERIRPLYLLSKFPYDVQKTPYYEITWICQFVSTVFGASAFVAVDCFFLTLVLHLCAQMKIHRRQLKDLLASTALKEEDCSSLDLSAIVERHKCLIWFAETVESAFNIQFLVQLLSSLLIFCLIGYQIVLIITKDVISVLEFLFAVYYYLTFTASLFIYCLIAMILSTESTKLKEAAYNSDWYRLSPSNAKLLIIIMIRTSRPFELTAGKFAPLSLQLYCRVLKTSGGYLSMLLAVSNRFADN